jgi:hypothetical protein
MARLWYNRGMAATTLSADEAVGRMRKVRKLVAGIDLLVEGKLAELHGGEIDGDLDTIWRAGSIFVRKDGFDWNALADELAIRHPSAETIRATIESLDERVVILNRRARPGNVIALRQR